MKMTESSRVRVWAAGLSLLAAFSTAVIISMNRPGVAVVYLALSGAVIAVGLETGSWGGMAASVVGTLSIVLFDYYAGVYSHTYRIFGVAAELAAVLALGPVAGKLAATVEHLQRSAKRWLALAEERAVHDETFGTLKPRWARVRLEEEALRASSCGRPLAVALLQLEPGPRAAVDNRAQRVAVLQAVIRVAQAVARPPAVVSHLGGDQVLVILPEQTPEQAATLAAALRQQLCQTPYFPEGPRPPLGRPLGDWGQVSIGLASLNGQAQTSESLIEQAQAYLQ